MNFNLDTAKAVIANLMVGDYDTNEQRQMHDELHVWAVRNETRLVGAVRNETGLYNTANFGAAEVAEIDRWRMFIEILDHIAFQLAKKR